MARVADVYAEALVLEMRDLVLSRHDQVAGPVARLFAYDEQHHANLVETFRAWLDHLGDIASASRAVFVHQNTFRYRLRRVGEVSGIDLSDPDARFAAMLQLRIVASR